MVSHFISVHHLANDRKKRTSILTAASSDSVLQKRQSPTGPSQPFQPRLNQCASGLRASAPATITSVRMRHLALTFTLKIRFHCRACRKAETWDPAMPAEEGFGASNLAGARWRLSPCPSCGRRREATILDPVESVPPPPPPGPRTMNMAKEGGHHA